MLNYFIMKMAANAAAGLIMGLLPVTGDSMSEKYYETVVDTTVIRNYVLEEVEDLAYDYDDVVKLEELSRVKYHDYDEKQDIYNFKFEVIHNDGKKNFIEFHDVQEHELWNG